MLEVGCAIFTYATFNTSQTTKYIVCSLVLKCYFYHCHTSVYMSIICASVHPSVYHLFIYQSIYSSIHSSIRSSIHVSVHIFIYLSISPSIIHPFIHPSIQLFISFHPSLCISDYSYTWVCFAITRSLCKTCSPSDNAMSYNISNNPKQFRYTAIPRISVLFLIKF